MSYPDIDRLSQQEKFLLKRQLALQLIDRELILTEAARLDIRISPDEFDQALATLRDGHSTEEFEQELSTPGKTPAVWQNILMFQLLTAKVTEAVIAPQINISAAEMEAYYHAHKENFRRPLEVRAHQMLFNSKETALEIKNLLQDGADFATLAELHSLSPDREEGGLLGYFSEGYLPPEFDAVIFALPLLKISDPVESPYGFHLFMIDRKLSAGLRPFAAAKEEIAEHLYREKEETLVRQWIKELRDTTSVSVDWKQIHPR